MGVPNGVGTSQSEFDGAREIVNDEFFIGNCVQSGVIKMLR
jgi:hypothetical protein